MNYDLFYLIENSKILQVEQNNPKLKRNIRKEKPQTQVWINLIGLISCALWSDKIYRDQGITIKTIKIEDLKCQG